MDEIKFRGQSNGRWVYGAYLYDKIHRRHFILTHDEAGNIRENKVAPLTVGQFIGQHDHTNKKHPKEIYAGDIVEFRMFRNEILVGVVTWESGHCAFAYECLNNKGIVFYEYVYGKGHSIQKEKIIGNKVDNPELLK